MDCLVLATHYDCYLCDLGAAPRRLDDDVPPLGPHRHGDGVRQRVHAHQHLLSHGGAEPDILWWKRRVGSFKIHLRCVYTEEQFCVFVPHLKVGVLKG